MGELVIQGDFRIKSGSTFSGNVSSASYVRNAQTSSYWSGSINNVLSSSYATTASYWSGSVPPSLSASYAETASYWNGIVISSSFSSTSSWVRNSQTTSYINPITQSLKVQGDSTIFISGSASSSLPNTVLHLAGGNGIPSRFVVDTYNSNDIFGSAFRGRRSRGNNISQSVIMNGDVILQLVGDGFDGTQFITNRANVSMFAAENWNSTTSQGTYVAIRTTPVNTTSSIDNFKVYGNRTEITGSLIVSGTNSGITGSLFGTSSFANTASSLIFNPTYSFVSGNITTTGQALVNIPGMMIVSCSANSIYEFESVMTVGTSAVATGTRYSVAFTGTGAFIAGTIMGTRSNFTSSIEPIFTGSLASTTAFLTVSNTSGSIYIKGTLRTGAGIGNLTVQHLKVTSGTSTIVTGSYLWAQRIV